MKAKTEEVLKKGEVLVLRTCNASMEGHGGFKWPKSGAVKCTDWDPEPRCGGGLHGLLWGIGDAGLLSWTEGAYWLAVAVLKKDIVNIDDKKVKFPKGRVLLASTDGKAVADFIGEYNPTPNIQGARGTSTSGDGGTSTSGARGTSTSGDGGTSTSGDGGTSTSGYGGTSTSGDGGTSTSGARGTSTSGDGGTSTSGDGGTSTSGDGGTSTSGYGGTSTSGTRGTSTSGTRGTSTSGERGTSTSGARGTSTSGDGGTSTSGYGGTSTSGDGGTSTSGDGGTSTSGERGLIVLPWYDYAAQRERLVVGYVGEDGIKPNVKYRLNASHAFENVPESK